MSKLKRKKEDWEAFEKRVGQKRTGRDHRLEENRALGKVPNDILVQRMAATPSGRLKKYEPLDTRDFVPFAEYEELSIENIKEACERFYDAPAGSCDILASDRGPSCTKIEQIKAKKVYCIRFLEPVEPKKQVKKVTAKSVPISPSKDVQQASTSTVKHTPSTVYPKSVSIGDLMKAGKLVKRPKVTTLKLEWFDVEKGKWMDIPSINVEVEKKSFASGAFRDAFKAKSVGDNKEWVIKKYSEKSIETITTTLNMTLQDHTRKQVQMHAVARNITARFTTKVPVEFGESFKYRKVFYSMYEDFPVTVEEFVSGKFMKYVNNDGNCVDSPSKEYNDIFAKAQCLTHFSYIYSKKKLMLMDIQGSNYDLYDPELATTDQVDDNDDSGEVFFCAGNLSFAGIDQFKDVHKCDDFCEMLELERLKPE